MPDDLSAAGLTATESKIYSYLLDLGKAQASLISRRTGVHRRSVYDALDRLIEKGLVSYIKENEKRYYFAEDPRKLMGILDLQRKGVEQVLPQLVAKFDAKKDYQETKFYRGTQGIKAILEDQILEKKEVFIIGASYNASKILQFYMPHYTSKRVKQKLKLHLIYCGDKQKFEIPFGKVAFLPPEFASPVSTNIYGNKVAIIVWSPEPVAILIKNYDISSAYKKYFDILWGIAKKI